MQGNGIHAYATWLPRRFHMSVEVEAVLLRVCELSRERAEALGVGLIVDCGGGVLDGDGQAFEDILANLVGNAIESTPSGQSVRLDTRVTDAGDQLWTI